MMKNDDVFAAVIQISQDIGEIKGSQASMQADVKDLKFDVEQLKTVELQRQTIANDRAARNAKLLAITLKVLKWGGGAVAGAAAAKFGIDLTGLLQ
jgi:hypothetical protein